MVPDQRHGGQGHSLGHAACMMFLYPKEDRMKILCCIYLNWKCVSMGESRKEGTWRTLGVPDWRHGGQGHS